MTQAEKRKFIRLDTLHLLDYIVVDKEGYEGEYSMGRTLDVSINGIKMETTKEVPIDVTLVITLGIEEDLVDISGKPSYCKGEDGMFVSGIEFMKVSSECRTILRQYVDEFQARKDSLLQKNDFPPK